MKPIPPNHIRVRYRDYEPSVHQLYLGLRLNPDPRMEGVTWGHTSYEWNRS